MKRILIVYFSIASLFAASAFAQVFDVPYESDEPTRTLLIPAKNAKAVVLLFPGGGGVMRLTEDGQTRNTHTFVRSQNLWAQYGIHAVLVDTPTNLGNTRSNFRGTNDHLDRIANVVQFYKQKFNLPVWIFGHSMGSSSVTYFPNKGEKQRSMIAGVIAAGTLRGMQLNDEVTLPTLAIHHAQDGCISTPPSASEYLIKSRPKGLRSELKLIEGGDDIGDACMSAGHHGFAGVEDQFVAAAAKFILGK